MTTEEFDIVTKVLKRFELSPVESIEKREELGESSYYVAGNKSGFSKVTTEGSIEEMIILAEDSVDHKLPISYALAQGTKLNYFEKQLQVLMDRTKRYALPSFRSHSIREVLENVIQYRISIIGDPSDLSTRTPAMFWEAPEQEIIWRNIYYNLDIQTRTELLRENLNNLNEIYSMLTTEYNAYHSTILEKLIILLIGIEAFFGFYHFLRDDVISDIIHSIFRVFS